MKAFSILLVMLLLFGGIGTAWADGTADAGTKLGRGVQNVAFGWFEVINEIGIEADRRGPWIGVPSGLFRGAGLAIARTFVGIIEILSFPVPNDSEGGFGPIIQPDTVFKRR